jgi:photosystem II Psb28-2 protein
MALKIPSIQFFEGVSEELSNVSLRRGKTPEAKLVLMMFKELKSIERFRSYTKRFANGMRLIDEEGVISVEPDSVQFVFGGPEGDDLKRVECKFEITQDDHWERFMRFMHRYAQANGMEYGETKPGTR